METRQVTEYRVYVLMLNTFGRAEDIAIVAVSTDYNHLVDWYNNQFAESQWRDSNGFVHTFKASSPICNYNPCNSTVLNNLGIFGDGIRGAWVSESDFANIPSTYCFLG